VREISVERKTRETDITVSLGLPDDGTPAGRDAIDVRTGVPFFDHMLTGMLFHGGFGATIAASGDVEIDDHHTVEDVGIVIGTALRRAVEQFGPVRRFGDATVPMDDSLAQTVIDACGRPYLVFRAEFPQAYAGRFDLALVREFFQGLANSAAINLHVIGHYGLNGHHLAEAIFKSAGRALAAAYRPAERVQSTKGVL